MLPLDRLRTSPFLLAIALSLSLVATACDKPSSATPPVDPATEDDGATGTGTCAGHAPTDTCMDENNFAQCQKMEAECPGEVLVMESCPLQFGCP